VAFVAAMHARTPSRRDHFMGFWNEVLENGEQLEHSMKAVAPEERHRVPASSVIEGMGRPTMSLDDLRKITASPMEHTLGPLLAVELPLLMRLKCFVLCTHSEIGFMTSDAPVVWFDPKWHTKPPLYRSASFSDRELEISMPLSPTQMLVFMHGEVNPQRLVGYKEVPESVVTELNRRTRFRCDKEFVTRIEKTELRWFEQDPMPADAWELNEGKDLEAGRRPSQRVG
jgi:Protein of unknown function (DUF4238)